MIYLLWSTLFHNWPRRFSWLWIAVRCDECTVHSEEVYDLTFEHIYVTTCIAETVYNTRQKWHFHSIWYFPSSLVCCCVSHIPHKFKEVTCCQKYNLMVQKLPQRQRRMLCKSVYVKGCHTWMYMYSICAYSGNMLIGNICSVWRNRCGCPGLRGTSRPRASYHMLPFTSYFLAEGEGTQNKVSGIRCKSVT